MNVGSNDGVSFRRQFIQTLSCRRMVLHLQPLVSACQTSVLHHQSHPHGQQPQPTHQSPRFGSHGKARTCRSHPRGGGQTRPLCVSKQPARAARHEPRMSHACATRVRTALCGSATFSSTLHGTKNAGETTQLKTRDARNLSKHVHPHMCCSLCKDGYHFICVPSACKHKSWPLQHTFHLPRRLGFTHGCNASMTEAAETAEWLNIAYRARHSSVLAGMHT